MFIAIMVLAGMIALNVAVPEPVLEPDTVHPFVNVGVNWEQSFHSGGWNE